MGEFTIIDLARELGLSKTTVSDALTGSGRVSAATRARVAAAADRHGFTLNRAARALRKSTTGALGLYVPPETRALSFYMQFTHGVAEGAAAAGLDLTLFSGGAPHARVDGAVLIDTGLDDPVAHALARAGVPRVTAGRPPEDAAPVLGFVEVDHASLVGAVLDRVVVANRAVGYVGLDPATGPSWSRESVRGHAAWCAAHDHPVRTAFVEPSTREDDLVRALTALAAVGTDTYVFALQGLASRAIPILTALGVATTPDPVPRIASLAGDPLTELGSSTVFAVDLHPHAFGLATVKLLVDRIAAGAPEGAEPVRVVHPVALD